MKSICGYWALDATPTAPTTLPVMRRAAVHNDAPKLEQWHNKTIAFGTAWWSPQPDLHAPQCLVEHSSTGCVVVADARLDNSQELRDALQLPAPDGQPDSTTDHAALLILHAWLRWGQDCVDHIDGDFAFVVFDPRCNSLYLARDRMASRPLYVHHVPGKLLVFGSTSHSVLAHPRVPRDLNEARVADFIIEAAGGGLEGVDFTSTFFQAVERLPPRHVLHTTSEAHRLRRYWQLEPERSGPLPNSDNEWADALTEALERAVAQRLVGPERVGSMLSGGLDSTSLAIIAGQQLLAARKPNLPTFSAIDSSLPDCKETAAIHSLLEIPYFNPTVVDHADFAALQPEIERFLDTFDEPFDANMILVDTQYLTAARCGVSAVIDGIDGDTLFSAGGTLRRQIRSGHWLSALENARGLSRIYGGRTTRHLLPAVRAAVMPAALRKLLWPGRLQHWKQQVLDNSLINANFALSCNVSERLDRLRAHRSPQPWARPEPEAAEALQHTFPVAGLERYGRVAARHGITPLHPFAERRLQELCVHLPDRQRLRDGWSKPILRHAMKGRMPESVRLRSDKQHLGARLTMARFKQPMERLHPLGDAQRRQLAAFLDLERLESGLDQLGGISQGGVLGQCLRTLSLVRWLRRNFENGDNLLA